MYDVHHTANLKKNLRRSHFIAFKRSISLEQGEPGSHDKQALRRLDSRCNYKKIFKKIQKNKVHDTINGPPHLRIKRKTGHLISRALHSYRELKRPTSDVTKAMKGLFMAKT